MSPNEPMEAQLARDARPQAADDDERARAAADRAAERRQRADHARVREEKRDAEALSKLQTLRYANGLREIRSSGRALRVGDVLKRDGQRWRVLSVDDDAQGNVVVTLGSEAA